ncbi:membrane-spanning 4-domains subfamily A member 15-like isoform 2-T3 [Vipera latastei]
MLETAPLLQKFLGSQPRTFGAVLVVLGLLQMAFGVLFLTVRCSYTDGLGIHFFSGSLLFLAGVISVIADRIPSIGLIKACLIFCIISAITAAVINFLYLRDILYFLPFFCPFTDKVQHGCRVSAQLVPVIALHLEDGKRNPE